MTDSDTKPEAGVDPPRPDHSPTVLDRDGDLTLVVGPDEHEALVCSRALSRASPVFKRMLYGPFSESRENVESGKQWIVELPEDDWQDFHTLLSVIHGQLPPKFPSERLHDLIVLADKYDMTKSFAPWLKACMPTRQHLLQHTNGCEALEVAWVLGAEKMLKELARQFLLGCSIDPDGNLIPPGGNVSIEDLDLPLVPRELFDNIVFSRYLLVIYILSKLQSITKASKLYARGEPSDMRFCSVRCATRDTLTACHIITLGVLVAKVGHEQLRSLMIEDDPKPAYHGPINVILEELKKVSSDVPYRILHGTWGTLHCNPIPNVVKEFLKKVAASRNGVTHQMSRHMADKRERLGVNWEET